MGEKLNFSLPEKKPEGSVTGALTVLLLVAVVALGAANFVVVLSEKEAVPSGTDRGLSAEQTKKLATKLAQRNLYAQAAAAWQRYLAAGGADAPERARIHFQIGALLEKAGLHGDAIEQYYRSELAAELDELSSEINTHVKQCFERLGKFSALRYELMDRTSIGQREAAGAKVVAEIGAEKITEAQLDALIEQSIEDRLTPMQAFMTSEQLNEQKKRLLEQSRSPQARREFLQSWLAQEILYRQALEEDLSGKPEVKRLLDEVTRGVLSQQLMNEQLASRINITETDLQTYYAANKDTYMEPARARISHIRLGEEERANDLLNRIKAGEDFAELAKTFSQDEQTKDNGGQVQAEVLKGSPVPGIGDAADVNESIFAAEAPAVLDKAFKTENGWEIIKVEEKHPERQKGFDEVRQQVMMELLRRKREDVQREYVAQMMNDYDVIIHTSVFVPAEPNEPAKGRLSK